MRYIVTLLLVWGSIFANDITITILYGNGTPDRTVKTTYTSGISALEALKQVSRVETYEKGKFTFVRSIDGVKSQIGTFGWFYLIDGESVPKTAESYRLNGAKTMTWVYKVEACY